MLKKYKEDFVLEHIDPGQDFDFGYNYTECAIHKLYQKKGKSEYLQYVCLGDYAMFQSYGMGFTRTQTIANGAPLCDFRFKKKQSDIKRMAAGKTPRMERSFLKVDYLFCSVSATS